jgi:tetratricopeptide (TPR) repeat protein
MSLRGKRDRATELRVGELLDEARTARRSGRHTKAVRSQREAIDLCRGLGERFPGDPRHRQSVASALYSLGAMLTEGDDIPDSIPVLDESARLYAELGAEGFLDAEPLVADVRVRRAYSLAWIGEGATAVAESDEAVSVYETLALAGDHDFDLARTLALNAVIVDRFGDPDVAVSSADRAVRIWLSRRHSPAEFMIGGEEISYLLAASAVASTVHARFERADVSLFATELGIQFLASRTSDPRVMQWLGEVREIAAAYDTLSVKRRVTLARECADRLRDLTERFELPPGIGLALADVLRQAGEEELAGRITRPALECAVSTSSQRCAADVAPAYAQRLAAVALRLLPGDTGGVSPGLEAHWLFAAASRDGHPQMRYELDTFGRPWAEVLLAMSETFEDRGDDVMALDLASWAAGLAQQLLPYTRLSADLSRLAARCLERHGRLLIAAGDEEPGRAALALAAELA